VSLTQSGSAISRQLARTAAARDELEQAIAVAETRGWRGCGDLITRAVRNSAPFKMLPDEKRFAFSYVITDGCWPWAAALKGAASYGQIRFHGHNCNAHRVSYEIFVGRVPDGLHLDHLCLNKTCVNPAHLEPVTGAENTRRYGATITHCPQGHEYGENSTRRGRKFCRPCHYARDAILKAKLQATLISTRGTEKKRLTDAEIAEMIRLRADGMRVMDIAVRMNVSAKYASAITTGSRTRRQSYTGASKAVLLLLGVRSGGICEAAECGREATQTHHRLPRRLGGTSVVAVNLAANLLRLCNEHHAGIESRRTDALAAGLLLHTGASPADEPVELRYGRVLLDNLGGWSLDLGGYWDGESA
jgi:hypothetical protein